MSAPTRWEPVTRWSPLKDVEDMEKRLSSVIGRALGMPNAEKTEAITVAEWAPLVDITEDEQEYLIKAEIPEMKKEGIKINVQDEMLTISGERKYEKEEKGKKYHRVERASGSFVRSFTLPEDADGSNVTAQYNNGVLKVHLPKSQKPKAKSTEVKIS